MLENIKWLVETEKYLGLPLPVPESERLRVASQCSPVLISKPLWFVSISRNIFLLEKAIALFGGDSFCKRSMRPLITAPDFDFLFCSDAVSSFSFHSSYADAHLGYCLAIEMDF